MGTRSYEDIMRNEKKDVIIQGSIRKLETLHKQNLEKIKIIDPEKRIYDSIEKFGKIGV